jgi:hypothetical protein
VAIGALAALTLSLGVTYWFVEERRRRRGGRDEKSDSRRRVADA